MTKPKATKDIVNRLVTQEGYFNGLHKLIRDYDISNDDIVKVRVALHKHLLVKVREGKKEVDRLQAALRELEEACLAGTAPKSKTATALEMSNPGRILVAMQPVDGWIISLLETNISLLATIHNPETAGERVNKLKEQFAELWRLRYQPDAKGNRWRPFDNYDGIFTQTIVLTN